MSIKANCNIIVGWTQDSIIFFQHIDDQTRQHQSKNKPGRFPHYYKYAFRVVEISDSDFIVADLEGSIVIQAKFDSRGIQPNREDK
jgi:hypothetical protein